MQVPKRRRDVRGPGRSPWGWCPQRYPSTQWPERALRIGRAGRSVGDGSAVLADARFSDAVGVRGARGGAGRSGRPAPVGHAGDRHRRRAVAFPVAGRAADRLVLRGIARSAATIRAVGPQRAVPLTVAGSVLAAGRAGARLAGRVGGGRVHALGHGRADAGEAGQVALLAAAGAGLVAADAVGAVGRGALAVRGTGRAFAKELRRVGPGVLRRAATLSGRAPVPKRVSGRAARAGRPLAAASAGAAKSAASTAAAVAATRSSSGQIRRPLRRRQSRQELFERRPQPKARAKQRKQRPTRRPSNSFSMFSFSHPAPQGTVPNRGYTIYSVDRAPILTPRDGDRYGGAGAATYHATIHTEGRSSTASRGAGSLAFAVFVIIWGGARALSTATPEGAEPRR